mmetsp:Transcript_11557/g.22735  ORF Transcript_11557/g.22735 Transcript_11557/m.22735 type:complete len:399 (+) Transcript_11557:188-1384(+)|eukprot:CAMPEP_0171490200 /NCGR_PEP_ID=MMETSP0958-20121227/3173_1 /TAXON_ID=87120 /ORGANISM="Aurantiochytrium limacinum, Strain ATCCMYA-1381" /LENGTH=398 /DNA_ID=CAMNT_0012023483 /DNA_START=94 /DNA_END=1290 /DNA_ORIENTATION=-
MLSATSTPSMLGLRAKVFAPQNLAKIASIASVSGDSVVGWSSSLRRQRPWVQNVMVSSRNLSSQAQYENKATNSATKGVSTKDPSLVCAEAVRSGDRPAFIAGTLMPADVRRQFYAIRYFNLELARIRDSVGSNEAAGALRCQWWRELVDEAYRGSSSENVSGSKYGMQGHPVFPELKYAIQKSNLTRRWLDRMIDARQDDIGMQQPETLAEMEKYAEWTASSMLYLTLEMLNVRDAETDHAASHAGKAIGLANSLNGLPFLYAHGQLVLPSEIMTKHALRSWSFERLAALAASSKPQEGRTPEENEELVHAFQALTESVYDVAATAHGHLEHARALHDKIPKEAFPAFLVTVQASIFLERLQSTAQFDIFNSALRQDTFGPLRLQFRMLKNSFLKTF